MAQRQRPWHIRRTTIPLPLGHERWHQAYTLVLQWEFFPVEVVQEVHDADRDVCSGLHHTARPCPNDRPPRRPSARLLSASALAMGGNPDLP